MSQTHRPNTEARFEERCLIQHSFYPASSHCQALSSFPPVPRFGNGICCLVGFRSGRRSGWLGVRRPGRPPASRPGVVGFVSGGAIGCHPFVGGVAVWRSGDVAVWHSDNLAAGHPAPRGPRGRVGGTRPLPPHPRPTRTNYYNPCSPMPRIARHSSACTSRESSHDGMIGPHVP